MSVQFNEIPTVTDSPNAKPLPSSNGQLEFRNVNFSYNEKRPVLKNVSFTVKPGTTTALVGETGSGKSTCMKLIFRFYDTVGGSVLMDGHDVRDVTMDSLRKNIGVVPQETTLFNDTLMYNLKYARPDATDEEVYEACRAASIHTSILDFPEKYDTVVGERGLKLSGGEKQRVRRPDFVTGQLSLTHVNDRSPSQEPCSNDRH